MIDILNIIADRLLKNKAFNQLRVVKQNSDIYKRTIYTASGNYDEYTLRLVFLINTGKWFDETLRFTITANSNNNLLIVRRGYEETCACFKYKNYKDIVKNIIEEILNMQNENFINNKLKGCVNYEK